MMILGRKRVETDNNRPYSYRWQSSAACLVGDPSMSRLWDFRKTDFMLWEMAEIARFAQEIRLVSFDHFQHELQTQLRQAFKRGAKSIVITATELNLAVGGKPGFMDDCFEALQSEMRPGDEVLVDTPGAASLAIRYSLPRPEFD